MDKKLEELTTERESWVRSCDKTAAYQAQHDSKRMGLKECVDWVASEQKSEARRMD